MSRGDLFEIAAVVVLVGRAGFAGPAPHFGDARFVLGNQGVTQRLDVRGQASS